MRSSGGTLRPRYGRIAAFATAASTTLVSLGGTLVADSGDPAATGRSQVSLAAAPADPGPGHEGPGQPDAATAAALASAPSTGLRASLSVGLPAGDSSPTPAGTPASTPAPGSSGGEIPLPVASGSGHRVVFSQSEQRVWLVRGSGEVARSYLVSGSVYDNLDPGSYAVYSRSGTATGVDGSQLRWMVRFAHGENAAIGFHSIPRLDGERMQTKAQLGTPLSHGCIRQAAADAQALWRFAPVGTTVVVTT